MINIDILAYHVLVRDTENSSLSPRVAPWSSVVQVKDLMKKNDELPLCKEGDMIMELLIELTIKGCGCLLVVDDANHLVGTFTDGDLRRTLKTSEEGIFKLTVGEMCNR